MSTKDINNLVEQGKGQALVKSDINNEGLNWAAWYAAFLMTPKSLTVFQDLLATNKLNLNYMPDEKRQTETYDLSEQESEDGEEYFYLLEDRRDDLFAELTTFERFMTNTSHRVRRSHIALRALSKDTKMYERVAEYMYDMVEKIISESFDTIEWTSATLMPLWDAFGYSSVNYEKYLFEEIVHRFFSNPKKYKACIAHLTKSTSHSASKLPTVRDTGSALWNLTAILLYGTTEAFQQYVQEYFKQDELRGLDECQGAKSILETLQLIVSYYAQEAKSTALVPYDKVALSKKITVISGQLERIKFGIYQTCLILLEGTTDSKKNK